MGSKNFSLKSTINNLKIQTKNPEVYKKNIYFLENAQAQFHTYQIQDDKAYRIVIRNFHPTTNTSEIKIVLVEICFQVRQITNILHKSIKIKLPIFFVNLEPSELNKYTLHVNHLFDTKVKI